jgi:hypothetical protein
MLSVLQVVVGIVFVLLLLSLLGTTLMELLSGAMALRGKHLFKSLQNMLGEKFFDFVSHPFYRQMMEDAQNQQILTRRALPSYISPTTFRSIFMDVLANKNGEQVHIAHHIENLKDGELKELLRFLLRDAKGDQQVFEYKVDQWFVQVMDRVSGWYKRTTRYWLLGVGMGIAVLFNADTISIYQALSRDAALRNSLNATALSFTSDNSGRPVAAAPALPIGAVAPVTSLPNTVQPTHTGGTGTRIDLARVDSHTSALGLGWSNMHFDQMDIFMVLEKIVGWFVTALAISLGAGFWFDALRRLVNINTTSSAPAVAAPVAKAKADEEGDG